MTGLKITKKLKRWIEECLNEKTLIFSLILIYFLIISSNFLFQNPKIIAFDTLREYSNMYNFFVKEGGNSSIIDWFMYTLNGSYFLMSGLDPFYIHVFGGFFIVLLISLFFFLSGRELTKNTGLVLTFLLILLLNPLIFSAAFYYRPQTFALLFNLVFFYYIIKSNNTQSFWPYFIISFIISLAAINVHKTTKIIPLLFIIFWSYKLFFSEGNLNKKRFYALLFASLFLAFVSFNYYIPFLEFYLVSGSKIAPAGFNQDRIPLSNFFTEFGGFLVVVLFLCILIFLSNFIKTKKYNQNIIEVGLILNLVILVIFFSIYFSFGYLLPNLGLFSVTPNRFDVFIYLFLLLILLVAFDLIKKQYPWGRLIVPLLLLFTLFQFAPLDFGDAYKHTADKNYLTELSNLNIERGDVIISTFTSSAALEASLDSKEKYSKFDVVIISGYNDWSVNTDALTSIREMFYNPRPYIIESGICKLINAEKEYLEQVIVLPEFQTPTQDEKDKMIRILNNPNRIFILIPLYDQNIRDINMISHNYKIREWWNYRTIPNINLNEFNNIEELQFSYESKNIVMFKYSGC
ncbi:hypothetical protein KAR91_54975 [Candidatus Pacearchaeota archaeon]|nr:hypothetical protein [Candidatus Pacearchaeota archaeon]